MVRTSAWALVALVSGCSLINPTAEFGDPSDAGVDTGVDAGGDDAGVDAGCSVRCEDGCVDTSTDVRHCGGCGRECEAPINARPICNDGMCAFECEPGYARVLGMCVETDAPRPIHPLSTARVSSRRPTLRWQLAPRSDGAVVEVCEDRACTSIVDTIDAEGNSARPPRDLPAGVVFWRLRSRTGAVAGGSLSATWQMDVPHGSRRTEAEQAWTGSLDFDGDGVADFVVGAPLRDAGRAYLYRGGIGGLDEPSRIDPPASTEGYFGAAAANGGDINGDGFADILLGAPDPFGDRDGAAYLFLGGSEAATASATTLRPPVGTRGQFGAAVASAGDVDGDGYADVLIGAPRSRSDDGAVYLYRGGEGGLSLSPQVLEGPIGLRSAFGQALASIGDIDGDGYGDVLVGAVAAVHLYRGGPAGLTLDRTMTSPVDAFGRSLAVGDVDADGLVDVAVGAPDEGSSAGAVYLFRGVAGGLEPTPRRIAGLAGGALGTSVRMGDVNRDGYDDLAMGAPGDVAASSDGAVHVFLGGDTGLAPAGQRLLGLAAAESRFGFALSLADTNADGFADLVVGIPLANDLRGSVQVFRGTVAGVELVPQVLASPDMRATSFGRALAARDDVSQSHRRDWAAMARTSRRGCGATISRGRFPARTMFSEPTPCRTRRP